MKIIYSICIKNESLEEYTSHEQNIIAIKFYFEFYDLSQTDASSQINRTRIYFI